jgi:hypothetical protein
MESLNLPRYTQTMETGGIISSTKKRLAEQIKDYETGIRMVQSVKCVNKRGN